MWLGWDVDLWPLRVAVWNNSILLSIAPNTTFVKPSSSMILYFRIWLCACFGAVQSVLLKTVRDVVSFKSIQKVKSTANHPLAPASAGCLSTFPRSIGQLNAISAYRSGVGFSLGSARAVVAALRLAALDTMLANIFFTILFCDVKKRSDQYSFVKLWKTGFMAQQLSCGSIERPMRPPVIAGK